MELKECENDKHYKPLYYHYHFVKDRNKSLCTFKFYYRTKMAFIAEYSLFTRTLTFLSQYVYLFLVIFKVLFTYLNNAKTRLFLSPSLSLYTYR